MVENPPAFPVNTAGQLEPSDGMTLRDWFAGQTLPAVIGMALHESVQSKTGSSLKEIDFAEQAYAFADAMLAARAQASPL